jgi:alpha-beta hydrolase superfamily lysophospholipase
MCTLVYRNTYASHNGQSSDKSTHHFIFSHGLGATAAKSKNYITRDIIPAHTSSFNYQDAYWRFEKFGYSKGLNLWDSCCGQDNDVKKLTEQIEAGDSDKIVIFGESRGAVVPLRLFYTNPDNPVLKKIKALVLDSPFDTMYNALKHRLGQLYLDSIIAPDTAEQWLPWILWDYKLNVPQPIAIIASLPKDIPILFICSETDRRVPHLSALSFYHKLHAQGHDKIHILPLSVGSHGWLMEGKARDIYRNVVHAFYKKYNIEHNSNYAQAGEETFLRTQPKIISVEIW